jgi:hypothetical protein
MGVIYGLTKWHIKLYTINHQIQLIWESVNSILHMMHSIRRVNQPPPSYFLRHVGLWMEFTIEVICAPGDSFISMIAGCPKPGMASRKFVDMGNFLCEIGSR